MRTSTLLKYSAHAVLICGLLLTWNYAGIAWTWWICGAIFSIAASLIIRVIANIGQIVFDIKGEIIRTLGNIERGVFQTGAMTREVRDILKEQHKDRLEARG